MNLPQPVFSEATYNTINPYDIDATAERMHTWAYESCLQQALTIQRHNLTKLSWQTWDVKLKKRPTHDELKEKEKDVND